LLLEAFHCRWSTAFFRGDVETALNDSGEGVARYDRAQHSWMGSVFGGHDPGVCAHCVQAMTLSLSGMVGQAKTCLEHALSLAETLKHPHTLAHALQNAGLAYQIAGDYEALERTAQLAVELADKYNFPPQRAHALMLSGWLQAVGQDSEQGLELMEIEFTRAAAIGPLFRFYAALLAEARLKFGKVTDALAVLKWALDTVIEPGVGLYVPELYRLQGMCLLRLDSGNKEDAMASLQMAGDIAKQQNALLFQLKAAVSMAAAADSLGQSERGLKPLRELWSNLPDGFEAKEFAEAKRLL
jgi:predicted ATPase